MSTREENLKTINAELEMLSDKELDQVAGGSFGQTRVDSKFLYNYGLINTWHSCTIFFWKSASSDVDRGWAKAGITCVTKPFLANNQYFKDGKEISREEAYKIVKEKFSKIHDIEEN